MAPNKLVLKTLRISSVGVSSTEPVIPIPALLTKTSNLPSFLITKLIASIIDLLFNTSKAIK